MTLSTDTQVIFQDVQLIEAQAIEIERLRAEVSRLEGLVYFDSLTGLLNRKALEDRLSQEWSHAQRNQASISILFLDLNGFKKVNDTQGHAAGDQLLSAIGSQLRSIPLRTHDIIARYAGDEFIVVLPDSSEVSAERVADQIHRAMSEIGASVSIGIASTVPAKDDRFSDLIALADSRMYEAKRARKNG